MKKLFIFVIVFVQVLVSHCQIYEVGLTYGKTNFIGDIGNTQFINPSNDGLGFLVRWNRSPRHSFRFSFINSSLSGDDLKSKDSRRIERGYNFSTNINEFSLGMEFNFLNYDLHTTFDKFTHYFYTGISYTSFDRQILENGYINNLNKVDSSIGIPIIIGAKYRVENSFILSFEIGARYKFTDKIDGNILNSEEISYNFGNINNNDWYMFTGFNITYTFGRKPCYCNID